MSKEFQFRVAAPLRNVWAAMPSVLTDLYPEENIGELATMSRHSVSVAGKRTFTIVTRLTAESPTTTSLSIVFNVRAYSRFSTTPKFRKASADRIHETLVKALNDDPGGEK